jgi:nicotinamide mononucleotide transporter
MTPVMLSVMEWSAVVLNVGFTLLIAWETRAGWLLGLVAGALGVALYALAHTWAMSVLNAYYVVMAVYGWWSWGRSGSERIITRPLPFHAVLIPCGLLLAWAMAMVLGDYLNGKYPYLDAFVTVFSFMATWMMARKYLSNWAYFIVADSVSVYLNWRIGYNGLALLNVIYLALSVIGLIKWSKLFARQEGQVTT